MELLFAAIISAYAKIHESKQPSDQAPGASVRSRPGFAYKPFRFRGAAPQFPSSRQLLLVPAKHFFFPSTREAKIRHRLDARQHVRASFVRPRAHSCRLVCAGVGRFRLILRVRPIAWRFVACNALKLIEVVRYSDASEKATSVCVCVWSRFSRREVKRKEKCDQFFLPLVPPVSQFTPPRATVDQSA